MYPTLSIAHHTIKLFCHSLSQATFLGYFLYFSPRSHLLLECMYPTSKSPEMTSCCNCSLIVPLRSAHEMTLKESVMQNGRSSRVLLINSTIRDCFQFQCCVVYDCRGKLRCDCLLRWRKLTSCSRPAWRTPGIMFGNVQVDSYGR